MLVWSPFNNKIVELYCKTDEWYWKSNRGFGGFGSCDKTDFEDFYLYQTTKLNENEKCYGGRFDHTIYLLQQ